MGIDEIFDEFISQNKDAYDSKIKSFREFLKTEKNINDSSYETYLKGMNFNEIIESLHYFIEHNKIHKRSVAFHYSETIKKFFNYLRDKGIDNKELFSSLGINGDDSFDKRIKDNILATKQLLKEETNDPFDEDDIRTIIMHADNIIKDSIKNKDLLFKNSKKINFNKLVAALCVKVMIFTGMNWNNVKSLLIENINTELNTITVNGITLHMPNTLSLQFRHYIDIRKNMEVTSKSLFIKMNTEELEGTSILSNVFEWH